MAQYSLNLSDKLYANIRELAKEQDKTVRELIIALLKTGLIALDAYNSPNKELCYKETLDNGTIIEKVIIIL